MVKQNQILNVWLTLPVSPLLLAKQRITYVVSRSVTLTCMFHDYSTATEIFACENHRLYIRALDKPSVTIRTDIPKPKSKVLDATTLANSFCECQYELSGF